MARTSTIILLTGDYADRLNALYAQAKALDPDEETLTLVEASRYSALQEAYEGLKAEAETEGIKVTLRSVDRKEWKELRLKHPPRGADAGADEQTVRADRLAGVNTEGVVDDLVYASLIEPSFSSRAAYDEWADDLAEGDFQAVLVRAWELANVAQMDPKSLPASQTRRNAAT